MLAGRYTATLDGDFVVFLIGTRINQLWAVHKWLPVTRAMPRMLRELKLQPALGLLHAELFIGVGPTLSVLQYWRSYDQLHNYAHARNKTHLPAWAAFNQAARGNTAVGIYHESYLVPSRQLRICVCGHATLWPWQSRRSCPRRRQHGQRECSPAQDHLFGRAGASRPAAHKLS